MNKQFSLILEQPIIYKTGKGNNYVPKDQKVREIIVLFYLWLCQICSVGPLKKWFSLVGHWLTTRGSTPLRCTPFRSAPSLVVNQCSTRSNHFPMFPPSHNRQCYERVWTTTNFSWNFSENWVVNFRPKKVDLQNVKPYAIQISVSV